MTGSARTRAPATSTCPTRARPRRPGPAAWPSTRCRTYSSTPTSSADSAPAASPAAPTASKTCIAALDLVQGQPFSQLRPGAWAWLFDGDRLDQHLTCAIVDVAHVVTTHALHEGDNDTARRSAETAVLAAPFEELPHLDLARVDQAAGRNAAARRRIQSEVLERADDEDAPEDLPARTATILHSPGWSASERAG